MGDSLKDMLNALPAPSFQTNVSLIDALPDPTQQSLQMDFESKPSLLASNLTAMSAAAQFAVLTHRRTATEEDGENAAQILKRANRKRVKDAVPKKKQEKRKRGKDIKSRTRGNQRV